MSVSDDRWSCPACGRTALVIGSQPDVRAALRAVQERHSTGHQAAAEVLDHLPLPDLPQPRTQKPGSRRPTRKDTP